MDPDTIPSKKSRTTPLSVITMDCTSCAARRESPRTSTGHLDRCINLVINFTHLDKAGNGRPPTKFKYDDILKDDTDIDIDKSRVRIKFGVEPLTVGKTLRKKFQQAWRWTVAKYDIRLGAKPAQAAPLAISMHRELLDSSGRTLSDTTDVFAWDWLSLDSLLDSRVIKATINMQCSVVPGKAVKPKKEVRRESLNRAAPEGASRKAGKKGRESTRTRGSIPSDLLKETQSEEDHSAFLAFLKRVQPLAERGAIERSALGGNSAAKPVSQNRERLDLLPHSTDAERTANRLALPNSDVAAHLRDGERRASEAAAEVRSRWKQIRFGR